MLVIHVVKPRQIHFQNKSDTFKSGRILQNTLDSSKLVRYIFMYPTTYEQFNMFDQYSFGFEIIIWKKYKLHIQTHIHKVGATKWQWIVIIIIIKSLHKYLKQPHKRKFSIFWKKLIDLVLLWHKDTYSLVITD